MGLNEMKDNHGHIGHKVRIRNHDDKVNLPIMRSKF